MWIPEQEGQDPQEAQQDPAGTSGPPGTQCWVDRDILW